jgi:hypothetical protein
MSRTFNMENVERFNRAVSKVGEIPAALDKGVVSTLELAVEQKAPKFLEACKNMEETSKGLKGATEELVEINSRIQSKYAGMQEGL